MLFLSFFLLCFHARLFIDALWLPAGKGLTSWLSFVISKSKKKGKDQESIQSSTTPDPGHQWESDNVTIKHHKREPRGQPFPSPVMFKCDFVTSPLVSWVRCGA